MIKRFAVLISMSFAALNLSAAVTVNGLFSNHMILQRERDVPVWGWASPGEAVSVTFAGQTKNAVTGPEGSWRVILSSLTASSTPAQMTVSGSNTITITDVLVGDVWVGAGQSNMAMTVSASTNAAVEIADSGNYSGNIREIALSCVYGSTVPRVNAGGTWRLAGNTTTGGFSAIGYFFAREIYKETGVPIGVIRAAIGGTTASEWISLETLNSDPALAPLITKYSAEYTAPSTSKHTPTILYNIYIAPIASYGIRGALWYQGESGSGVSSVSYQAALANLIYGWRQKWGQGEFPFLIVQLPNFTSAWMPIREAQSLVYHALPNTGLAVTIDIGSSNIHPVNKQEFSHRLELLAREMVYGESCAGISPDYSSKTIEGDQVRLHFTHVGSSFTTRGEEPVAGFEIAGADLRFVRAAASIDGTTIVVSSNTIVSPLHVRYAWAANPTCNVYSAAGLPLGPFRTNAPVMTADRVYLSASPSFLWADGRSTSTITAQIRDSNNCWVFDSSAQLDFQLSGPGSLQGPVTLPGVNGYAACQYLASKTAGNAVITAVAAGLTSGSTTVPCGLFAPSLEELNDSTISTGRLFEFSLSGTAPGNGELSFSCTNLPAGAVLNGPVFSWTPTHEQAGTYILHFEATNGTGSVLQDIRIIVVKTPESCSEVIAYPTPCYMKQAGCLRIARIPLSETDVKVYLYSIDGTLVRTLREPDDITVENGRKTARWDGKNDSGRKVASGVYFYLIKGRTSKKIDKIVVIW